MRQSTLQKYVTHPLQGIIAHTLLFVMALVPVDWASGIGGWIARTIGPRLPVNKRAVKNLKAAFPEKSDAEIKKIIVGMWDNLGRVAFEFAHAPKMNVYELTDRFEIHGTEYIDMVRGNEQAGIIFSAHFANWEFSPKTAAQRTPPVNVHSIYREPDNPWMRSIFAKRKPGPDCQLLPKGSKGAKQALNLLKSGENLALLVDQKMNDGIAVPFFGRDAMTAPAMAQFALKFGCPIIPMRIERLGGVKFRATYYPPLEITKTGDRQADILKIMTDVNMILEDWIRERPEQWLWLHNRWPKN